MNMAANFQELSKVELQSIDGGTNWWLIAGGVTLAAATVAVVALYPPATAFAATPAGGKIVSAALTGAAGMVALGIYS